MSTDQQNSVGIVSTQTIRAIEADTPLELQSGKTLAPIDVAYETYGQINQQRDNVILICHALSGNAHVAGLNHPDDEKPGWWDIMIGPGKYIDTNKYYVICSNFLGGCSGTTGPSSINPETGKPYGIDFPIFTIADMVSVQKAWLDKLGIKKILSVIGGSMGGMQVLQWTISYPEMVDSAMIIASTSRLSAQSIAFDAVGRNAILEDGNFNDGQYHDQKGPAHGLSIARMIGHITYLSEESMRQKFGRELQKADKYSYDLSSEFAVESYLDHQGQTFIERFDANSYLYITKAMDYFDLARSYGSLEKAFASIDSKILLVSFASDWLFPTAQSEHIVSALTTQAKNVSYCNIDSPYGHDAFLLEPETLGSLIEGFVDSTHKSITAPDTYGHKKAGTVKIKFERAKRTRVDYELIDSLVAPNSRVLDIGSGDGELLAKLINDKSVAGEGIELDQDLVIHSIRHGLSAIQRDIERGLDIYPDNSFDYAILSQTLQTVKTPGKVLSELHRVAKKVIVSFPNFGNYKCRLQLLLTGKAPRTRQLPFHWHDSPNIHSLSLKDFDRFCKELDITIEKKIPLRKSSVLPVHIVPNLFAEQAVYLTSKD